MFPRKLTATATAPMTGVSPQRSDNKKHLRLYCAIYRPQFGNYYHWAFAVQLVAATAGSSASSPDRKFHGDEWHVYEVVQEIEDGAFESTQQAGINPASLLGFRAPLISLGEVVAGGELQWKAVQAVVAAQSIGEPPGWNCQDYVLGVWEGLRDRGVVSEETWRIGKARMLPFFGPDFGEMGSPEDVEDESEEVVGDVTPADTERSAEFVAESDEDW